MLFIHQIDARFGGQESPAYSKREYRKKYRQQARNGHNNVRYNDPRVNRNRYY